DGVFAAGIGAPVPARHARAGDAESVAEGGEGAEEGFGLGGQVLGEAGLSRGVEDDAEEGPGVPIDAGIESGGGGRLKGRHGEGLRGEKGGGGGWVPTPSSHTRAFMSIQALQQTGAAILVPRGITVQQAAPAAELCRSATVPCHIERGAIMKGIICVGACCLVVAVG